MFRTSLRYAMSVAFRKLHVIYIAYDGVLSSHGVSPSGSLNHRFMPFSFGFVVSRDLALDSGMKSGFCCTSICPRMLSSGDWFCYSKTDHFRVKLAEN
jgi:hypothetical protein